MASGEKPRALVLSAEDRTVVVTRLARSVLRFQDDFLSRDSSPAGLLCQAGRCWGPLPWLPVLHVGSPACRTAAAYATYLGAAPKPPTPCAASRWPALPSRKPCARCWLQVWLPDVVEDNQIVLKTKVGTAAACVGHPGGGEGFAFSRCWRTAGRPNSLFRWPGRWGGWAIALHRSAAPSCRRAAAALPPSGGAAGCSLSNRGPPPPLLTPTPPRLPGCLPPACVLAGHALLCRGHRRPAGAVPLHLLPLCIWHHGRAVEHAGGARPRLHVFRGVPGGVDWWLGWVGLDAGFGERGWLRG
jgi:hypothetical protein